MFNLAKLIDFRGWVKYSLLKIAITSSITSVALGVSIAYTNPVLAVGKIVVNNDEWTLSNTGFSNAPDAGTFVNNTTSWFTGGGTGKFHAYSNNFGFTQSSLASTMANAGNTWTTGTNITFDLPTLLQYDGIFVG
jgi:hypothetical protein